MEKLIKNNVDRRHFLQLAAWAAAGTLAAKPLAALSHEHQAMMNEFPALADYQPGFFDEQTRAIVTRIADMTLPKTDTPGALDANVPAFLEMMVEHWMNEEERSRWNSGIDYLKTHKFDEVDEPAQQGLLGHMEAEASDSPWYQLGNIIGADFIEGIPFICQIKELTVCGFMLSEIGANEFLAYAHVAGDLEGDIPLEKDQPTWASGLSDLG